MKKTTDIRDKLLELHKLEAIAVFNFTEAKNALLKIRRQIHSLEKLLTPSQN
jgi:hypothetical protein